MELKQKAFIFTTVSISPDGRYAVTGTTYNPSAPVRLWNTATGEQIWRVETASAGVTSSVGFSPDGKYIVAGGDDLVLIDSETGKIIRRFGKSSFIGYHCTVFSPDGKSLLAGGGGGSLELWDVATGKKLRDLKGHKGVAAQGTVNSAAFSSDGNYAFSGGSDGTARLWKLSTGENTRIFEHAKKGSFSGSTASDVTAVMFMPDPRRVVSWGTDGTMKIWDVESGENIEMVKVAEERFGVFSAAVSPDRQYTIVGAHLQYGNYGFGEMLSGRILRRKSVSLRHFATGKKLREYTFETPEWSQFGLRTVLSPDGKRLFVVGDGAMRILDAATLEEMAMLTAYEDGEWIIITAEGYYHSSEKGARYLSVQVDDKKYDMDLFYDVFYRPDIVAAKLRGEDIKDLITIAMKDAIKSPPPLVEVNAAPSSSQAKVCYRVTSRGGGIGEVRLFHNGKLIESDGYYRDAAKTGEKPQLAKLDSRTIYEDMRSVKIKEKAGIGLVTPKSKGEVVTDCKDIDAVPGENEISITAFNRDNTVQSSMQTVQFTSSAKRDEPHLYILSIGIDRYRDSTINLKYAVKDSRDMNERIIKQASTLYEPRNIHHVKLADAEATKANITGTINELSKRVKPADSFVLFVAGHGVLLQNQYYLLTSDYDGRISEHDLISSNEIVEMSKRIRSLSQLFIFDTCHAGGVDSIVSGLYDARMSVLAKKMGLHIYASANSMQQALDGYQGNGLFTHTLLDGLNNRKEADRNNDKAVSLVELGGYAREATTEISKKTGHAQTSLIINFGRDIPIYNLE